MNKILSIYPHEMWKPKNIHEQVEILSHEFDLPTQETIRFLNGRFKETILPPDAYGWFAVPDMDYVQVSVHVKERYQSMTEMVLEKVSQTFSQFGSLACKSTPEKFSLSERTRKGMEEIRRHQTGSLLIIPIGFGKNIHQSSTTEAEMFPLGSFLTACLALTHRERYTTSKDTRISETGMDCIGFGPVSCGECWFENARTKWNHATGFVPKFKISTTPIDSAL